MTQAHAGTRQARRWRRLVAVLGAVAMLSTGVLDAEDAVASSHPPVDVLANQPTDGTTAYVASVAPRTAGAPAHWQLKLDFQLRSTSGADLTVDQVWFSYPGSGVATWAYEPYRYVNTEEDDDKPAIWEERDYVLPANGDDVVVPVFDGVKDVDVELNHPGRELTMPVPETVVVEITFEEVTGTLVRTYDLAVYENDTPTGGLLFPANAADLAPGEYWHLDTRHTVHEGGWPDIRVGVTRQRYALDMVVRRHDGSSWSQLNDDGEAETADAIADGRDPVYVNEHYLSHGLPVHAMAGGVVTRCAKGHVDHPFTGKFPTPAQYNNDGFGNHVVIDHGDAAIIYAHMRYDTIPDSLCPGAPGTDRITGLSLPVEAGAQIGEIGNTGRSTGPHTHVEAQRAGSDGVPFNFLNVRIASDPSTVNNIADPPPLHPVHGATLPSNSLVLPNPCGLVVPAGGGAEYARHGVPGECWQDVFNIAVTAGYSPSYVDAYEDGGDVVFNGVFRKAGPATIARHGLTGAAYQDLFDELTAAGYRLHQVDSYLDGGAPRIAAIFQQRHGPPGWAAHHLLSTAEHDQKVTEYTAAGLVPVNLSWVVIGGQRRWTALFEQHSTVTDWDVVTAPAGAYQAAFDAQVGAGRVPVEVDVQLDGGMPFITAVFAAPFAQGVAARHGLSSASYQDHFDTNLAAGRLTRAVAGGVYGGIDRFAAVWRGVPSTTITSAPPTLTNSDSATFGFVSSDPYATLECARGTAPLTWQPCTSTTTYNDLPEGDNTFRVRAVDREQFRDPTPATHTWFVDTVAPEVTLVRPAENAMYVHDELESTDENVTRVIGSVTVVAHAVDPSPGSGVATVTFTVDGVPVPASEVTHDPQTATWSFLWEPPGPGKNTHAIGVTATDHATNSASTSRTVEGTGTGKP